MADIVDKLKDIKLLLEDCGSDYWDVMPDEINPGVIDEAIKEIERLRMFIKGKCLKIKVTDLIE